jgi:metal-responsive CopG/Arc/MetJ family transcriptional regulator
MKAKKPRPGQRWPKGRAAFVRVLVSLPPELDAAAIEIGGGKRSPGVQIAIREAIARRKK